MKTPKTTKQVIDELELLFNAEDYPKSKFDDGLFYISKEDSARELVVSELSDYFSSTVIIDGRCELSGITLMYTSFKVV